MPPKQGLARKHGAKTRQCARATTPHTHAQLRSPNSDALTGLEGLDEATLLSLSMDTPVRLTPPPGNDRIIPESSDSSPTPLSRTRVSNELMQATLDRLGFGPPNDLSSPHISVTSTPTNSEAGTAQRTGHEEKVPTAEDPDLSMDASGTDEYGQIIGLFQRIAQRTGHSVSSLIVEWALLHARTNMVEKRETMRQQAFEERVNKAIELVGEFFFSQLH
jgi:hypothetical protein